MQKANIGSHALAYRFDGPESGQVVVFCNSLSTDHRMWDAQVAALSTEYRVLRFDTRGHGQSDVVEGPCSVLDMADDLNALLKVLQIEGPVHLVGLSLGGMVAQAFAARHPERVRSLALCATTSKMKGGEAIWNSRIEKARNGGTASFAPETLERWFTPAFAQTNPGEFEAIRNQIAATPDEGYIAACAAVRDVDVTALLGSITAPTLAIAADNDPVTPPDMMRELVSRIAGAKLEVIGPARHLLNIEQPAAFNAVLQEFLSSNGR